MPNQRPVVTISSGPIERGTSTYQVRVDWYAFDPDGQVVRVLYATDPPLAGDTTWTVARQNFATFSFADTTSRVPAGSAVPQASRAATAPAAAPTTISFGYHTVVLKAIDDDGQASCPVCRTFTPTTVAPFTVITAPIPTPEIAAFTTPSLVIQWRGTDPDGSAGTQPTSYAWTLVTADSINPPNPYNISQAMLQEFFARDAATRYAGWNRLDGSANSIAFQDLPATHNLFFAIVAFDETGAFDPHFDPNANVLQFRPTLNRLGPAITVFNSFFAATQRVGGVSLDPSRIHHLSIPVDQPVAFNWTGAPISPGDFITGYRWALDLADVSDSTVRSGPQDLAHWSDWSLRETDATVGPFPWVEAAPAHHFFYVEARNYYGQISLFTIDLAVVQYSGVRSLLIVDDMNGTPTQYRATPPYVALMSPYPMEAEQDSFYYAVGGYPDSLRILSGTPGAHSIPGTFSHFAYDTLDYHRAWPLEGIDVSVLAQYRVVCWYTDAASAFATGSKFGSSRPMTALRFMNSINQENSLALYLSLGGKAWLFGEGTTAAIANGYYTRYSLSGPPRLPYAASGKATDVLQPGSFLWDFCHLRSAVDEADAGLGLSTNERLVACLPYLPQYALPPGGTVPPDRSLDPRVGPSAQKTLDHGWGSLPRLTVGAYRGIGTDPFTGYGEVGKTFVVAQPLFITEGAGAAFQSVADTLYLCQSAHYDPSNADVPTSDGFPNAIHYYGSTHGDVVWMGFPLYIMQPDQARQLADVVLTRLGLPRAPAAKAGAHAVSRPRVAAR